ncbi:MAG: hypothetical protein BroJett011_41710 [Chloroflexota bacterium]|nr:MAG: hypothetical protein BroJett011_41710 [Chloroflexota bacterium]
MASTVSDIIRTLPRKLQNRFESLEGYVRGVIAEEEDNLHRSIKLSDENIRFIQLAALIYLLETFFRAGTRSARGAAIIFEQFGSSGFQIGSATFTRDNYETRRGEVLADGLLRILSNTSLNKYIISANSMRELVSTLVKEMAEGESDDGNMDQY